MCKENNRHTTMENTDKIHEEIDLIRSVSFSNSNLVITVADDMETVVPPEAVDKPTKGHSSVNGIKLFVSYLGAAFGMIAAGLLLNKVQFWPVFMEVPELYILIPPLLGIKGTVVSLSSRLLNYANLGHDSTSFKSVVIGNLCLVQFQANIVSFLASMAAVAFGWIFQSASNLDFAFFVYSSCVITASISSLSLSLIIITVVILCKKLDVNFENITLPLSAGLSDLLVLSLLAVVASLLKTSNDLGTLQILLSFIVTYISIALVSFCGYIAWMNKSTSEIFAKQLPDLVSAAVITSAAGILLDYAMSSYRGICLSQFIINGFGFMAAMHALQLSTSEQKKAYLVLKLTAIVALVILPVQLLSIYVVGYFGQTIITPPFVLMYMSASSLQVFILLIASYFLVVFLLKSSDTNRSAVSYLTALSTLLGIVLLTVVFHLLFVFSDIDDLV